MMKRITLTLSLAVGLLCTSQAQVMMLFSQDSLAGIVSPLDVDSLFYWFAADVGVTDSLGGAIATDEGVGTWNDLSGNGHHVTQSTNGARPVWKATGGPGSKPCIQFDGTNDFLASAAHFWGSDDITVFVVMKFANATRDAFEGVIAKGLAGVSNAQFILQGMPLVNSYALQFATYQDGTVLNSSTWTGSSKDASYRILAHTGQGNSTASLHIDGANQTYIYANIGAGDGTIYNAITTMAIGARSNAGIPLQGSISEIIVFSRALSATERAAIENYLNKKYDLY